LNASNLKVSSQQKKQFVESSHILFMEEIFCKLFTRQKIIIQSINELKNKQQKIKNNPLKMKQQVEYSSQKMKYKWQIKT
jgi:hypothetical protein